MVIVITLLLANAISLSGTAFAYEEMGDGFRQILSLSSAKSFRMSIDQSA